MITQDLKIETWRIERLIPYARNARLHSDAQVAQIAASMVEFGFNNPVLVEPAGYIIAGAWTRARRAQAELCGDSRNCPQPPH
jgi:ParB-like chromosome segregation protein Spo0J